MQTFYIKTHSVYLAEAMSLKYACCPYSSGQSWWD